ncbi:MAG TPA: PEP-CTERM sorting domain-containing protein [Fimbriimonas sp.]|nr:PEP-CTERM sorting domain-containing protein [Fimbriimonas sp.]
MGLASSLSFGAFGFSVSGTNIRSGFHDTSNLYSSAAQYDVDLFTDFGDDDLYINGVSISAGTNYDPLINFEINLESFVLGTAITGGDSFRFENIARRFWQVDSSVAAGFYDFNVDFFGGVDGSDNTLLGTLNFEFEVIDMLEFSTSGSASPAVIPQGGVSTASATLNNPSSTRSLFTTTWYYSNGGFAMGSEQLTGDFVGNWFDKEIAPGDSRTDDHTTWTASTGQTVGVYDGNYGIVGGYYANDEHLMAVNGVNIEVTESVPEPASLAVIGAGVAFLARRRRNK